MRFLNPADKRVNDTSRPGARVRQL